MLTRDGLEAPRLLRDAGRPGRQCVGMRDRCRMRGVVLRPHLKTAKSIRVACRSDQWPVTHDRPPGTQCLARIVDTVQGALREAIFHGTLRAGEQLSVPELARRLNVSRSPVREAVLGLIAQGLAVEQPRRGAVVATVNPADLLAIHEIRIFLEAGAARLAAQRITDEQIKALRAILREQEAAVKSTDAAGYFRTNAGLHRIIANAAGRSLGPDPGDGGSDAHRAAPIASTCAPGL